MENNKEIIKSKKVYVVGHKNPDTDSICSAIAYAYLKREITGEKYSPRRAGQINEETQYVLNRFKVKAPKLLTDVKLQVKDADIHVIEGAGPNVSIKRVWELMKKQHVKTIPVLENGELQAPIWMCMTIRFWERQRLSTRISLIHWMGRF